jgi:hypothetical protein
MKISSRLFALVFFLYAAILIISCVKKKDKFIGHWIPSSNQTLYIGGAINYIDITKNGENFIVKLGDQGSEIAQVSQEGNLNLAMNFGQVLTIALDADNKDRLLVLDKVFTKVK